MANPKKPSMIFSPGGWHTGALFKPTTDILSFQGYKCTSLNLPSVGCELRDKSPPQDWNEDVEHIRNTILYELNDEGAAGGAGSHVVLVVHSSSGAVGSEACKGLDERTRRSEGKQTWVMGLVYLSALVLDVGGWIWEATGGKPFDERTIMQGDLCYPVETVPWFYNRCPAAHQTALPEQLRSQAWKTFLSKVTYTAWRDIPSWYLYSTNDNALPLEVQKAFTAIPGGNWTTMTCDADHSPMVSRPDTVVEIVRKAAGESF